VVASNGLGDTVEYEMLGWMISLSLDRQIAVTNAFSMSVEW
jgi:hypothetical protein